METHDAYYRNLLLQSFTNSSEVNMTDSQNTNQNTQGAEAAFPQTAQPAQAQQTQQSTTASPPAPDPSLVVTGQSMAIKSMEFSENITQANIRILPPLPEKGEK